MSKYRKNFKKKLHLVCGTDDLRPVLTYVIFDKGCAVCTDAHVMVKRSLKLDDFTEAEIAQMEGKALRRT